MPTILVTGDCQSQYMAIALQPLMPDVEVRYLITALLPTDDRDTLTDAVRSADTWLRIRIPHDEWAVGLARGGPSLIEIPSVLFRGFHPDCTVALTSAGVLVPSALEYSSAIGLWAWRHGLEPTEAEALFDAPVMAELGYLAAWARARAAWAADVATIPFDMRPVVARLMRRGCFMHTFNHPRMLYYSLAARAFAAHLGRTVDWDEPLEDVLMDPTGFTVWPVYPPIATFLGIPGNYRWLATGALYSSPLEYLEASWTAYGDNDPSDVRDPYSDEALLDTVLTAYASRLDRAASS